MYLTGDIGSWTESGCLKIVDRKKHIFKLAQGEYVTPEKIEQVYVRMPLIQQIFVDGISTQRYLIAVVVPDEQVGKIHLVFWNFYQRFTIIWELHMR